MAPALSDSARKLILNGDTHPRRALTSVGNLSPPMDDEMGLQNAGKDSQDMEQMLVELGGADIAQADLLQAIKTLEGGDGLSTGDADAIFPLSGFERDELLEAGDSESDAAEDKIRAMQARLDRRSSFLLRRMRIHQARAIGKRVSDETVQVMDRVGRVVRRDSVSMRPSGLKSVLKRIETTAALQTSSGSRNKPGPSYYKVCRESNSSTASLGIPVGTLASTADTAGALRSHLRVIESHLDSDATASSSGAESNDEAIPYTNMQQEPLPVEQRALWVWQRRRASLAARWSWLQAQVQELEYKIRQHTDLHRQVRAAKGSVQLESPGGYEGPLPGQDETCARTRPLRRDSFRKRKLLQMHNVHTAAPKAAKPADIRCGCQWPLGGCAVCTGREVSTQPLPSTSTLQPPQRLALLDPSYHPVLSQIHDVSPSIHMAAMASQSWWCNRARSTRGLRHVVSTGGGTVQGNVSTTHHPSASKRKYSTSKLKKNRSAVGRKSRDTEDVLSHERGRVRGGGVAGAESGASRRVNSSSFDIDNIVIPPSVAATTRLEILHYKEIPTPKWRILDMNPQAALNGVSSHNNVDSDSESEEEDMSEASALARHSRAEQTEKGKYARKKRTRRSNHQNSTESQTLGESNDAPPPVDEDWGPVEPPPQPPTEDILPHETVRPFSPRLFPLDEATYRDMLIDMPHDHPLPLEQEDDEVNMDMEHQLDDEGPESPMSPLFYDDDDPNDPEWIEQSDEKR